MEILPDKLLHEAIERMIRLIVIDSHLLNREVVEINVLDKNNQVYCVLFRNKGFCHSFVGVSKPF